VPDSGDGAEPPTSGAPDEQTSGDESTTEPSSGEATGDATGDTSAVDLLSEAEELFVQADEYLRQGDLGGYQQTIALAKAKVAEAIDALNG
jgi:hypothetical protein